MTRQTAHPPADARTWRDERFTRCGAPDLVLIGLIVALSGMAGWFGVRARAGDASAPRKALLYSHDHSVQEIGLDAPGRFRLAGGIIVEVRSGKVAIVEADCPDRVCVKTGWIRHPGEVIVCVPNKALVEVAASQRAELDAIAR